MLSLQNFIPADWISPETGLTALFAASFLGATVLPGGSEAVLAVVLLQNPSQLWPALLLATLGNTLGGMTSYLLGRYFSRPAGERWRRLVQHHGAPMLLLAWAPVAGDLLCIAAGWLRIHPALALLYMAIGKFVRYAIIAIATG